MTQHLCTDEECIYLGKPSASSCSCYRTPAAAEIERLRAQLDSVKYHYGALSTAYDHSQAQLASARKALEGLLDALPVGVCLTFGGIDIDHTKINEAKRFAEVTLSDDHGD